MHIHPSSPNSDISLQSEESAAIKIQAGFRGYRVRKQLNHSQPKRKSVNGYQRLILRRQQKRQQPSGMSSETLKTTTCSNNGNGVTHLNNPPNSCGGDVTVEEERSATKIQAGVRGYLVRKKQKLAADAATKIQAGFRGFKARKEVEKLRQM